MNSNKIIGTRYSTIVKRIRVYKDMRSKGLTVSQALRASLISRRYYKHLKREGLIE